MERIILIVLRTIIPDFSSPRAASTAQSQMRGRGEG